MKKGQKVDGVRDGSTAVVSVPLEGLLEAGIKVGYTANQCYATEGIDGCLPARLISSVYRLSDGKQLWPTADAAVNLAVQRDQGRQGLRRHRQDRGQLLGVGEQDLHFESCRARFEGVGTECCGFGHARESE